MSETVTARGEENDERGGRGDPVSAGPDGAGSSPRSTLADVQSGAARAAVLGINDGLVTNVALILGIAGASTGPQFVRIAGLASLVAGACSMAVGEYVSMRAQVDLLRRLLLDQREAMERDPAAERRNLQALLERRGLDPAMAFMVSRRLSRDADMAVATYARVELGLNPDELGSPWMAAGTSLVTFALGAALPLAPWLFWEGTRAAVASICLAGAAALCIGGVLGQLTERRALRWALRQLFIVALAAGVTYGVGRLFHVNVA